MGVCLHTVSISLYFTNMSCSFFREWPQIYHFNAQNVTRDFPGHLNWIVTWGSTVEWTGSHLSAHCVKKALPAHPDLQSTWRSTLERNSLYAQLVGKPGLPDCRPLIDTCRSTPKRNRIYAQCAKRDFTDQPILRDTLRNPQNAMSLRMRDLLVQLNWKI